MLLLIGAPLFAFLIYLIGKHSNAARKLNDPPAEVERAAEEAEDLAAEELVRTALNDSDVMIRDLTVEYEGNRTELDLVILNENGAFIVDVRNYGGQLEGGEKDAVWSHYGDEPGRLYFAKKVKNPIPGVRRQVRLLSGFFSERIAFPVGVTGLVLLSGGAASPVRSKYLISSPSELDALIHTPGAHTFTKAELYVLIMSLNQHVRDNTETKETEASNND